MWLQQEKKSKNNKLRTAFSIVAVLLISTAYMLQLGKLQIVDGDMYRAKGMSATVRTLDVSAPRGEIVDRNGIPLIVNRMGCSVVFDAAYFPSSGKNEERNAIIAEMLRIADEEGETWVDKLPITVDGEMNPVEKQGSEAELAKLKEFLGLNDYATAQNCYDALVKRYGIQTGDAAQAIRIASVRYNMDRSDFSVSLPFTFAEDVSDETVQRVKENSATLPGVDIEVESYREYADGTLAPHILGMVGAINEEEYERLKDEGYKLNDSIGKNGIEGSMEEYLRGVSGTKTVTTEYDGTVKTEYTVLPKQGNTVVLTIDSKLQRVAQEALERRIKELNESPSSGPTAAGAVCVVKCDTGEVLAAATYPGFDISTYNQHYKELNSAENSPLWNRVTKSAYAPGSTFKPAMALAGLTGGAITRDSYITCTRVYSHFAESGPPFKCLGYHGSINVVTALLRSCNIFFYETGRRLGIENMNYYCRQLGLGERTGVEIEETAGTLGGPDSFDGTWTAGYTIQAAIGQANNAFTPLQMAIYTATVANGGRRCEAHMVREVRDSVTNDIVLKKDPVVLNEGVFSAENIATVQEGMTAVGTYGSVSSYFAALPFAVAGKTGTAQTNSEWDDGWFISFGPSPNPEIAVAVIIEKANGGAYVAKVTADIYEYYFGEKGSAETEQSCGTLLP